MHRILSSSVLCSCLLVFACSHRDSDDRVAIGVDTVKHEATGDIKPVVARFVDRLSVELDLTATQTMEMKKIFSDHARRLQPHLSYIGDQPNGLAKLHAFKERESQIAAIRQDTDTRVQGTLDDAQYAEYLRLQNQLREQIRERVQEG